MIFEFLEPQVKPLRLFCFSFGCFSVSVANCRLENDCILAPYSGGRSCLHNKG